MDYSDDAQMMAALESAAQADDAAGSAFEQATPAPAPVAPAETPAPVQPVEPVAPAAPAVADTTPPNLWDGTPVNPDTLPDELKPLAGQLQAAFTQKTQALAEERRQFSALGSPEEVQQAVELYTRISDPTNWPQLHTDLATLMEQYGLSPAEAAAEASATISDAQAAGVVPTDLNLGDVTDPELAPLYKALQDQQARIDSLTGERQAERTAAQEAEKAQRLQDALMGEITRQENAILQSNPSYKQKDMDAIIELSSFYGGNLLNAQARYEALRSEWVGEYIASKGAVAAAQSIHPGPAGGPVAEERTEPETLQEAADGIEEYMRRLGEAGEIDFG